MTKSLAVIRSFQDPYHLVASEGGRYHAIPGLTTLTDALRIRLSDLRKILESALGEEVRGVLQAPVALETEIWGAGVTYLRSRDARKEESDVPDVYQLVYEAERPELFFKATAGRVIGTGVKIGIRADSLASVPEPEVAIVINRFQEIIGLTICNDVTARTMEGENPLYLSQAKIYVGSGSLGPTITPIWDIGDLADIQISARIDRGNDLVWQAHTSLGSLRRTFPDLVSYLFRCQIFPDGVILSTGTGIVPSLDVSLEVGDSVSISVDRVGTLTNQVALIPLDIHAISLGI